MFQNGLENLLKDKKRLDFLKTRRVGLLAHPASVDKNLNHALDLLIKSGVAISAAFGPQHGIKGEKQDNMMESEDFIDPHYHIPMFSLYGAAGRRLTPQMLDSFDVLLIDLQDLGCRIYTFLTTLCYALEDCAAAGKSVWVLERPNPAGRMVEGLTLKPAFKSFVGVDEIPMRHGLTLGEFAQFYKNRHSLNVDLQIIKMRNYWALEAWPNRPWVNPSPNAATLNMARVYGGTVFLEGTNLSEGRGTTRPLECFGAPNLNLEKIFQTMKKIAKKSALIKWQNAINGALWRQCFFEPTFHKFSGKRCAGFFIHTDFADFNSQHFSPWRAMALFFKAVKICHPEFALFRDTSFVYEYERGKLAFDLICGSEILREWLLDSTATPLDLEPLLQTDESHWQNVQKEFLLY